MHQIFTTEGIVLKSDDWGEGDRIYTILTNDFALIRAIGIGVRKTSSKLSPMLEPIGLGHLSFVKGKNIWRITGAEIKRNFFFDFKDTLVWSVSVNLLKLINSLVDEEFKDSAPIFSGLKEFFSYLLENKEDKEKILASELFFLTTFLYSLGRMDLLSQIEEDIKRGVLNDDVAQNILCNKKEILQKINSSLKDIYS